MCMLKGGKKMFACLLSSPRFCDRSLREAGPERRLRTILPGHDPSHVTGAHTPHSSCSLTRPVTRTVANTWMQEEPASGRVGEGSELILTKKTLCAGHWDGETAKI